MSSTNSIVQVDISVANALPTQQGFNTPLVAGYHTRWGDRVRKYSDIAGLESDGFTAVDPIHQIVAELFEQNPSVSAVKVGRRALAYTQVIRVIPVAPGGAGTTTAYAIVVGGTVVRYLAGASTDPSNARETGTSSMPGVDISGGTPGVPVSGTVAVSIDGAAPVTATLHGTPATLVGTGVTFPVAPVTAAHALHLHVNGAPLVIPFVGTESAREDFIHTINLFFTGHGSVALAATVGTQVGFTTARIGTGTGISVDLAGSDADVLAALGLAAGAPGTPGTGNFADATAVTGAEFGAAIVGATGAAATAGYDVGNHPFIQSSSTGGGSTVQVQPGSTLLTAFGLDTLLHRGGDTLASVCTALAAAINTAAVGTTAVGSSGTRVDCTAPAGRLVGFSLVTVPGMPRTLALADLTTDPGIATDLAAILAADSDFYGVLLDSNSQAEVATPSTGAAAWTETNKRVLCTQHGDSACADPASTTDPLYVLKAANYTRTVPFFQLSIAANWLAAGMVGNVLPDDPGSDTWMFKTLAGVTADVLTDTEKAAVLGKNGNTYTTVGGADITEKGTTAQSEFADTTVFIDWLHARMQARIFALQLAARKLPFTDTTGDLFRGEITAQLKAGIRAGGLAADPEPTVFVPKVKDISAADKRARRWTGITFAATLAGAVHFVGIKGTVTP